MKGPIKYLAGLAVICSAALREVSRGQVIPEKTVEDTLTKTSADAEVSAVQRRFQYGFRLNLRGVYDNNIFLRENNPAADFYFAIEPGVTVGFGDIVGSDQNFVRLDYAPGIFLYLDHADANALQHIITVDAQYHFRRLRLFLSQVIQFLERSNLSSTSSGPNPVPAVNLDLGTSQGVNIYSTHAHFAYDLTGKTFLSGGLQHTFNDYESDLISSQTLSGNLFINFTYSPKLVVGLGATTGYNWVDSPSQDQRFHQINARFTYQVSGKVSLNASGGVEFRHSEGDTRDDVYISPVYEIGATWQPFDGTSLSLNGNRRTQNSAVLAGQDYASTTLYFSVRQRFFQRVYVAVALGYENSTYFSTGTGMDASRDDDYFFIQPAIDVTLTRFWTAGVYYLHRENNSSTGSASFDDDQFGLRLSLTF